MWDVDLQVLFTAKKLNKIVNGKLVKPGDDKEKELEEWETKDALAKYYILRTIDNTLKIHVLSCSTSKDMYDSLVSVFKKDTEEQKSALLTDFFNFKYDKSKDILTNFAKLQNLSFRLNQLKKSTVDDQMLMARFTAALPQEYNHFHAAWESTRTEDRTIEKLKARLLSEEGRLKGNKEETKAAFNASYKKNKYKKKEEDKTNQEKKQEDNKNKRTCYTCGKPNHESKDCYRNKTYPTCKYCKKDNHPEDKCYYKEQHEKRNQEYRNRTRTAFLTEAHVSEVKENTRPNVDMKFLADSGCTGHMSYEESILTEIKNTNSVYIKTAKQGETMTANVSGVVEGEKVILKDVSYVPNLTRNLLSVNAVTNNGGVVVFDSKSVKILPQEEIYIDDDKVVLEGIKTETGLYEVDLSDNTSEALLVQKQEIEDWHQKLGHLNYSDLKKVPELCNGVPQSLTKFKSDQICESCEIGKKTRKPFNSVRYRARRPMEIIHTDICGKIQPSTYNNEEYFMTCMDDYTHYVKVYLLHYKSEASECLKEFINSGEAHFNLRTEMIRCDNGGEYVGLNFKEWCKKRGIKIQYTIPYSSELNGKGERLNLTLMNKVRPMLYIVKLSNKMWGYAVETAAYLMNRSPTKTLNVTPYEMWTRRKPDLSRLQIFGTVVYTKVLGHLRKLDNRATKGIFVGYTDHGYRIWNPKKQVLYISRDVTFTNKFGQEEKEDNAGVSIWIENLTEESGEEEEQEGENRESDEEQDEGEDQYQEDEQENQEESEYESEQEEIPHLRPQRLRKLPEKLQDYVLYALVSNEEALLTYEECMEGREKQYWKEAIKEEKQCLEKNHTWILVDAKEAKGKEIVSSKWVFKKKDDNGDIKYKARLVARGCQQKNELDFADIYSSVVQTNSLRTLLAVAAARGLHVCTFDVKSAFLNGDLHQEVYMKLPEGYNRQNKICRLKKAIYGLKQAPRQWNVKLTEYFKKEKLEPLKSDKSVFKSKKSKNFLCLAIHVDDGVVIGEKIQEIETLMTGLEDNFEMKINVNPKTYLGMELCLTKEGIQLTQENYAKQVIEKYKMQDSHGVKTPISHQDKPKEEPKKTKTEDIVKFPYREAVGSLLYLSCKTRPDICFAVNYEARSVNEPNQKDIVNIKRTLRYLNQDPRSGIYFFKQDEDILKVEAFCDSDFAGDLKDRKSTTGFVIKVAGGPVIWSSRKQSLVAQSTTEAEYVAAAHCCKQLKCLKYLLEELTEKKPKITFNLDNQGCVKMIKSGQTSRNSNHIDIKYHLLHDEYTKGWFDLKYCPTDENLADILTKPLQPTRFQELKTSLLK